MIHPAWSYYGIAPGTGDTGVQFSPFPLPDVEPDDTTEPDDDI